MTKQEALKCVPIMMILAIYRERARRKEAAFRRYWKGRKICDFTKQECEMLRAACNFTPEEQIVFDLRAGSAMIVATAPSIRSVDFSLSGLMLPAGSVRT